MDKILLKFGEYFAEFILKVYQKNPTRFFIYYQMYCRYYSDESIPIVNDENDKRILDTVAVS
jgi:CRISPR/Cas system Type II protein with McrA/HNH and RuvC-like nuclease domain